MARDGGFHVSEAGCSAWVQRFAPLIAPRGQVLDLACGNGRHARFLESAGLSVTAVDRDAQAVAALRGRPGIEVVVADLEGSAWPLAGRRFDAVVVTNYLHRPLCSPILAALDAGGVLLYETFMEGNARFGRPSNPDFLLRPGELLEAFAGLEVVAFEQGEVARPRPAMIQRLCAVRAGGSGSRLIG